MSFSTCDPLRLRNEDFITVLRVNYFFCYPDNFLQADRGGNVDYEQLKIKSYKHWDVYLHENQYYLGRVFVQLKEEGAAEDFLDIDGDVRDEFSKLVRR